MSRDGQDNSRPRQSKLGGVIHTYQRYDPTRFPPPTAPAPDVVSGAFEHLLAYGSGRRFTEEELARAVKIDPSQIAGLGPSIDAMIAMLEDRKRKLLATYETEAVQRDAHEGVHGAAARLAPPKNLAERFRQDVRDEQLHALERLWYRAERLDPKFAGGLVHVIERLQEKYEVDELVARYTFTGRTALTVPEAIELKEELEKIDRLLEQLREARENATLAVIDLDELSEFAEPESIESLGEMQRQLMELIRQLAEDQGLERNEDGYAITPAATRLFQSKLLDVIFSELEAGRRGRHEATTSGDGAVEIPSTKPYEFGDSVSHMDIPGSLINAMIRTGGTGDGRINLRSEDIEIHRTRNTPKCATSLVLDMSGSMRHGGLYVACKRLGLALDGLIRREYPGDVLRIIEMASIAHVRPVGELPELMPKPVTIRQPVVRLRADLSDPDVCELDIPPHFTNIQQALRLSRQMLAVENTPNRQVILITDGLPTAHFEGSELFLLYPPDPRTERATMAEAQRCADEGITINVFLLPSWSQTEEDIQFAQRMVEATKGRVFLTGGGDLDRFVLWDYVAKRRSIIG